MNKHSLQEEAINMEHQTCRLSSQLRSPILLFLSQSTQPPKTTPKGMTPSFVCKVLIFGSCQISSYEFATAKTELCALPPLSYLPNNIPTVHSSLSSQDWKVRRLAFWRPILDLGKSLPAFAGGLGGCTNVWRMFGSVANLSGLAAGRTQGHWS